MSSAFGSPFTRVVAIVAAGALALGSVAGVAIILLQGGNNTPTGDGAENPADATPIPITMEGTIPLSFAVVEESTEGACAGAGGLQTVTEPVSCLRTGVSLDVDRVEEATAFPIEGSGQAYVVTISLLKNDAGPLEEFTGEHLGKQVAIVAGGEALLAPRLDQPIRDGLLTLTDPNLDRTGAMELARRFTG